MKTYKRTAALLLSAALMMGITGCLNLDRSMADLEEETEEAAETEATETSETAVETSEEIVEETVTYSEDVSDNQTTYDAFREFVDSFVEDYEGELLFSYEKYYFEGNNRWQLHISYPDLDMTEVYECVDGVVTYVGTLDYYESNCLPYDLFTELPCLLEIYNSDIENDIDNPVDGRYFGGIEAAAVDGSYVLLMVGDPVILTEEEYNSLEIGDVIDCPASYSGEEADLTVTDITETNGYRDVEIGDGFEYWFIQGAYTEDPSDYMLMTSSDNPVWFTPRMMLVPIAEDCEVTDTYSFLMTDGDGSQFEGWNTDPDANALTSSVYWYFETQAQSNPPEEVNGWVSTGGLVYPVVIENGEVTSINIEWR